MPIVIREHTLLKDFEKLLPKIFHKCRRPKLTNDEYVTLVFFPEKVVHSRSVLHTLEKVLPTAEQIVMYVKAA